MTCFMYGATETRYRKTSSTVANSSNSNFIILIPFDQNIRL
jgi:hypothetical protein